MKTVVVINKKISDLKYSDMKISCFFTQTTKASLGGECLSTAVKIQFISSSPSKTAPVFNEWMMVCIW